MSELKKINVIGYIHKDMNLLEYMKTFNGKHEFKLAKDPKGSITKKVVVTVQLLQAIKTYGNHSTGRTELAYGNCSEDEADSTMEPMVDE
jgi:hypothetical protein